MLSHIFLLIAHPLTCVCLFTSWILNIAYCPSISGDKDDSDSDFADIEESGGRLSYPTHGAGTGAILGPNGIPDTASYTDNPMHSRSDDLGERSLGDNDSLSLSGRGKKERKRQDLPPLGKGLVPVAPLTPLGGVGSCTGTGSGLGLNPVHPAILAPLVINGAGPGAIPSDTNSPTGRDFGSHLGNTTSPMSNIGLVALGRESVLLDELARKDSAALDTEDAPVKGRDEGPPLKSLHPHSEDILNIAHKFSTRCSFSDDKLDRDRESVSKDLKDLLFSDGPEKRHIALSRRSTGNIVTGHSLLHLQSSSAQREPLNASASADNYEAMSASALGAGHNTGDERERQMTTLNSSSSAPHLALSAAHLFKMDLADSGVSFDPASMKHTVKSIRISR